MNTNRHHAHTPSKLTAADHIRMANAVTLAERERSRQARKERTARAVYWGAVIVTGLTMFYSL